MKNLAAVILGVMVLAWASMASAQAYSALEDSPYAGPYVGVGGLLMSGDNAAGDNDSEFIPTINISGLTDFLAWQAFYGMGQDSTVMGGSLDYIVANNFDQCFTCPDMGAWWFGVGGTIMDTNDLYFSENDSTAAFGDTLFGANLGFGYIWDRWAFNLYAHYMTESQLGIQGSIMYDVTK